MYGDFRMKEYLLFVVCACAAWAVHAACPSWPSAERFVLKGDEATDTRTGLTWKRCSEGQSWSGTTCTSYVTAHTHEQALALTKAASTTQSASGWRLPSVKELASLTDKGCNDPAIDTTVFPATPSNAFWSSSPYVYSGISQGAWSVSFGTGGVSGLSRYGGYPVRLVRSTQ